MQLLRNPVLSLPMSVLFALTTTACLAALNVPVPVPALLLLVTGWHLIVWLPVIAKRFSLRTLMVFTMLVAVYLGGVKSAGFWSGLTSSYYRHRADSAGWQVCQFDVLTDGDLSPGELVNVVIPTSSGQSTLVASGAMIIKVGDSPGRSAAVFAVNRQEAQKIVALGYRSNYRLVRTDRRSSW